MSIRSRFLRSGAALAAVIARTWSIALPSPAQAQVFFGSGFPGFGFGFGFPGFYYPPPVYYPPPPVMYAPPPMSYAPTRFYAPPPQSGGRCNAGPYVCPMERPAPIGKACYCRSNTGGTGLGPGRQLATPPAWRTGLRRTAACDEPAMVSQTFCALAGPMLPLIVGVRRHLGYRR